MEEINRQIVAIQGEIQVAVAEFSQLVAETQDALIPFIKDTLKKTVTDLATEKTGVTKALASDGRLPSYKKQVLDVIDSLDDNIRHSVSGNNLNIAGVYSKDQFGYFNIKDKFAIVVLNAIREVQPILEDAGYIYGDGLQYKYFRNDISLRTWDLPSKVTECFNRIQTSLEKFHRLWDQEKLATSKRDQMEAKDLWDSTT